VLLIQMTIVAAEDQEFDSFAELENLTQRQ
jgi:hypothetical protein